MSYSRWGQSRWYTYWSEQIPMYFKLPTKKLKRRQVFHIQDYPSYSLTYGELEDLGMGIVWDKIRKFYWEEPNNSGLKAKKPSETEMRELMVYIEQWRIDIDNHFKLLVFLKYEWYFPLRNKILRLWKRVRKK